MTVLAGKDFLLQIGDSNVPSTANYTTLGGLRATTLTFNGEAIDVTNQGSNQYKEYLDGAGLVSMALSGNGVFDNSSGLQTVRSKLIGRNLWSFCLSDGVNLFKALFKITKLERQGDYKSEQTYSISMESSGTITIV